MTTRCCVSTRVPPFVAGACGRRGTLDVRRPRKSSRTEEEPLLESRVKAILAVGSYRVLRPRT